MFSALFQARYGGTSDFEPHVAIPELNKSRFNQRGSLHNEVVFKRGYTVQTVPVGFHCTCLGGISLYTLFRWGSTVHRFL